MHDYTAWKVHEDRMRDLTREADAFRLAATAKEGQTMQGARSLPRRLLSFGLAHLSVEAWRSPAPDHRRIP
jgi:hypothetical protein